MACPRNRQVVLSFVVVLLMPGSAFGQVRDAGCTLTLTQILDSVAGRHPSIQAARAHVRVARGLRAAAGALGNPMLMYQVENAALPRRWSGPIMGDAPVASWASACCVRRPALSAAAPPPAPP